MTLSRKCKNPWKRCRREDIQVVIKYKGKLLPICRKCWLEIANSDKEWGDLLTHEEDDPTFA